MNVPAWLLVFILATLGSPLWSKNFAAEGANLVDEVCRNTSHYSLCLKTLKSDIRSPKSDVRGLSRIVFEAGLRYANSTLSQVRTIVRRTRQKELRHILQVCEEIYGRVVKIGFPNVIKALEKGDLAKAHQSSIDVDDDVASCHDAFEGSPFLGSPLVSWNDHLEQLVIIAYEILDRLG